MKAGIFFGEPENCLNSFTYNARDVDLGLFNSEWIFKSVYDFFIDDEIAPMFVVTNQE